MRKDVLVENRVLTTEGSINLPYGKWTEANAEHLSDRKGLLAYFDAALVRAERVLANIDDETLMLPIEQERAWMGQTQMGMHL